MLSKAIDIKYYLRTYGLLLGFIGLQGVYWYQTEDIRPETEIVPEVPGRASIHAMTFGDDEFYFRTLAFMLQNSGDTYGQFSPLRYYDFNKLYQWFTLLDELDAKSNMLPSMASYYFSSTQNTADVRYMVDYLYSHAVRDVEHKWWWLLQTIYLSMHKLGDMDLALKAAKPLQDDHVPVWAREMTAVVYEKRGEMDDALKIMNGIKANVKNIPDKDLAYISYFIDERIKKLEHDQKEVEKSPAFKKSSN